MQEAFPLLELTTDCSKTRLLSVLQNTLKSMVPHIIHEWLHFVKANHTILTTTLL